MRLLEPHRDRVTWDANIHSIADIEGLPFAPRMVNLKPSRLGGIKPLFDAYDYTAERGIGAYGGGQFELGVGRGQIHVPRVDLPSRYAQRHVPGGLSRDGPAARPADEPAGAGAVGDRLSLGLKTRAAGRPPGRRRNEARHGAGLRHLEGGPLRARAEGCGYRPRLP